MFLNYLSKTRFTYYIYQINELNKQIVENI